MSSTQRNIGFTPRNRRAPAAQRGAEQAAPQSVGAIQDLPGGEQARLSLAEYAVAGAQVARDLGIAVLALVGARRLLRRGAGCASWR